MSPPQGALLGSGVPLPGAPKPRCRRRKGGRARSHAAPRPRPSDPGTNPCVPGSHAGARTGGCFRTPGTPSLGDPSAPLGNPRAPRRARLPPAARALLRAPASALRAALAPPPSRRSPGTEVLRGDGAGRGPGPEGDRGRRPPGLAGGARQPAAEAPGPGSGCSARARSRPWGSAVGTARALRFGSEAVGLGCLHCGSWAPGLGLRLGLLGQLGPPAGGPGGCSWVGSRELGGTGTLCLEAQNASKLHLHLRLAWLAYCLHSDFVRKGLRCVFSLLLLPSPRHRPHTSQ